MRDGLEQDGLHQITIKAANDNGDSSAVQLRCDVTVLDDIVPGEAELIARYLDRLLATAANDN